MHTLSSAFVLGYHGCDLGVADHLIAGEDFRASDNDCDWLGPGVYFWEANPKRGIDFAEEAKRAGRGAHITKPAVVGAVIDLGPCLDLTTSTGIDQVAIAYDRLRKITGEAGLPLPRNSADLLLRNLDCAVIRMLHQMREDDGLPALDTVKGVFVEGGPIYPDAGIHEKTHIQICVCNPERIKGVFRVPKRFLS